MKPAIPFASMLSHSSAHDSSHMVPHSWRRLLSLVRAVLALSCLALQIIGSPFLSTDRVFVFVAYAAYACVALFWHSLEESGYPSLALLLDFVFFSLIAIEKAGFPYWIGAAFYVYVLLEAVMLHSWWKCLAIGAASVVVVYWVNVPDAAFSIPALVCTAILACLGAVQRQYLENRLSNATRQTVLYRYDAEKAREAERQRIAADFHDGPLQSFISFQMRLEIIRKLMARDISAASEELCLLQEICKGQVDELRNFVRSMRPVEVEGSLTATLRRFVQQFQKDSGIAGTFVSTDITEPEPEIAIELLQIVREALYNVQKHSAATRVSVSVQQADDGIEISIQDNGHGFPFSGKYTLDELDLLRLGPMSIKRRVRTLGAELLLDSRPGEGADLKIRLAT